MLKRRVDFSYMLVFFLTLDIWQAVVGEEPLVPPGPQGRKAKLPDPVQRAGPGLQPDGVVGGTLLLPPAAADRNCHIGGHLLHQKGCCCPSIFVSGSISMSSVNNTDCETGFKSISDPNFSYYVT